MGDGHTFPRRLATLGGTSPGPTLVITGGIHGNEPAGLLAFERFAAALVAQAVPVRGTVVGFAGNRAALALNVRFIDRDLNRRWSDDSVHALARSAPSAPHTSEDAEQRELLSAFASLAQAAGGQPLYFVDLHTTSGEAAPFVCFGDTLGNRDFALTLPLPAILGLEECIDGTMLGWLTDLGHVGIAVEAGQHDSPEAVSLHESVLWILAAAAGAIAPPLDLLDGHRARLRAASKGVPPVLEIRHRHTVEPDDGFEMRPGFRSFESVRKGTLLATDRRGEIVAGEDALMLMPRYQPQGEDGFFLARPVAPFWLKVSALARHLGSAEALPYLPGVRSDPNAAGALLLDPRVARYRTMELMHLVGYRRRTAVEGALRFTRRREAGPAKPFPGRQD
jgi:succinylglutamate desuccinylase